MKMAWLTDIHLNFIAFESRLKFYETILATNCDVLVITGDIAEAPSLVNLLGEMSDHLNKNIYFIVGNHDYYQGSVDEVRNELIKLCESNKSLYWLPASGLQHIENNTILLGQDGWADGRLGNYQDSHVRLNDSRMIADLFQEKLLGRQQLLQKMQELADYDALALRNDLNEAVVQRPQKIIVLTHIPPFKEACRHMGQISDEYYLPYFSSKVMGEVLLTFAQNNPEIEFEVLCGHTHSVAFYHPNSNLTVKAGSAEYYYPTIQEIITV